MSSFHCRVSLPDDVRDLTSSINATGGSGFYKAIFGPYHLPSLLDLSYLSLVVENKESGFGTGKLSNFEGFIAVNDSIPLMTESQSFERVIEVLKYHIPVSVNNTLFISFWLLAAAASTNESAGTSAAAQQQLQRDELTIARNMVIDVFHRCPHIDYLVWGCPASFSLPDHIAQLFAPITYDNNNNEDEKIMYEIRSLLQGLKVLVLHRSRFLPRLQVRTARVEDNDDLLPIIHHSNPEILDGQDHYFLADLIHRADEKNRFFVGLNDHDRPVGLLATSLDVNMALIMKIFNIDMYPDLVIRSDHLPPSPPLFIGIVGDLRLLDLNMLKSHLSHDHVLLLDLEKQPIDWKQYGQCGSGGGVKGYVKDQTAIYYRKYYEDQSEDTIDEKDLLQAVILWGLPSSEEEASQFQATIINDLDVILELVNTSEEVEDDEEDEFLQRHLDGVEVLRESFFSSASDENLSLNVRTTPFAPPAPQKSSGNSKRATWRKVSFDKDTALQLKSENISRFYGSLTTCFDERNDMIAMERTRHLEKPPTANGFAITALCLHDMFLSRSMDLLKLAFEEQKDLDYCLFMLPNTTQPTIATRLFTFVHTRAGISFDQSLFILHRSHFLALDYLHLERMTMKSSHEVATQEFINNNRVSLEHDIKLSIAENDVELHENPSLISFAVKMGTNHVIGVLVLSRKNLANDDVNWLRAHYHLDEQVNYSRHRLRQQYILQHWNIDPLFTHFTRLIIQHVMRICHKTLIYYHPLLFEKSAGGQENEEVAVIPPKELMEEFAFIRPRRKAQGEHQPFRVRTSTTQDKEKGEEKATDEDRSDDSAVPNADSPLFLMTKNQLSSWKIINAQRLVIVGGSTQSWSFLETVVSVPGVYYPNLFLVLGLPPKCLLLSPSSATSTSTVTIAATTKTEEGDDIARTPNALLEDDLSGCLSLKDVDMPLPHELKSMGYAHRIGIVKGHMTDIDREHHAVVISDELVIEFDYLLISSPTIDHSARRVPSLQGVHPSKCADAGIFSLGNPTADLLAITWALRRTANRSDPIIICGTALKGLAAAEGLIRAGIEPNKILLALSDSPQRLDGCNDAEVAALVAQSHELGQLRQVLWRCEIAEVSLSRTGFLQAVDVKSLDEEATMVLQKEPCAALFLCSDDKDYTCERDVFSAINDCGLVFDGGLVVDLSFRTVDERIRAVSDYTRFSRVHRNELPHRVYNPRETGVFAALQLLQRHLYPTPETLSRVPMLHGVIGSDESKSAGGHHYPNTRPNIRFSLPRAATANLPGDVVFFRSTLPFPPSNDLLDYVTDNSIANAHRFGPPAPKRVTCLRISSLGIVSEICYAGLDTVETRNLAMLPGKHEMLLNSAVHAHSKSLVKDWIEFFREEWATAIFVDSFQSLITAIKKSLSSDKGTIMLLSRIFERMESVADDLDVAEFRRSLVGAHGELIPDLTQKTIETSTMDFLRENAEFLPKFHMQGATR